MRLQPLAIEIRMVLDPLRVIPWVLLALGVAALPFCLYLLVVSLGALGARRSRPRPREKGPRFLIAIPAHDEEAGIGRTVQSCLGVDYPASLVEVLVIADNCQDRTAECARQAGAAVLERHHMAERSKGHALKYLLDHLNATGQIDRFDAVVVVDADTVVDRGLLWSFADRLEQGSDWVQALNTVANWHDSWRTRLMTLSFTLINGVLLLGQTALGLSAALRGNGMCLSTRGLRRRPWHSFGLVEDIEYSWTLRIAGERVAFAPEVAVHATMLAEGGVAAVNQRLRWEHGRRQLKRRVLGPLLRSPALGPIEKLAATIELLMPPLIVLTTVAVTLVLFAAYCLLSHRHWAGDPLVLSAVLISAVVAGALAFHGLTAFLLFGLDWTVLLSLTRLPGYALWRLTTLRNPPPERWVRTDRAAPTERPRGGQPLADPADDPRGPEGLHKAVSQHE
jgi:cellulose synthase/poly-beta-1,6-N-acetylglucosamine synthase-like glycosyltransferase